MSLKEDDEVDHDEYPRATFLHFYKCDGKDGCNGLHVVLLDEDENPIADGVLAQSAFAKIITMMGGKNESDNH